MNTLAVSRTRADLLSALRGLGGRATVGDVVSASGIPADEVRAQLKALLETHRGHLSVSDSGELLYEFDPRFITRDREPLLGHRISNHSSTHGLDCC